MIRHLQMAGCAFTWVCAHAGTLHAEKAPRSPAVLVQESDLVLVGTILALKDGVERSHVETGFGNYDWAIDLTLRIQSIEKGHYDPAETIVVRSFRTKSRKSATDYISPGGNNPIPAAGQQVRAHLYRNGELWRVVHPNGLAPVTNHASLVAAAAIPASSGGAAFTYVLPMELWIFIAGFWIFYFLIRKSVRHFRRREVVG